MGEGRPSAGSASPPGEGRLGSCRPGRGRSSGALTGPGGGGQKNSGRRHDAAEVEGTGSGTRSGGDAQVVGTGVPSPHRGPGDRTPFAGQGPQGLGAPVAWCGGRQSGLGLRVREAS